MVALWNRADHYIFMLWFLLSFFFSLPNLSGRRLNIYRTSTHDRHIEYCSITRGNDLRLQKTRVTYDLRKYYFTNRAVYLTMLFCLIQLTCLNLGLINSGNTKILFMISKQKFLEPEVGAVIRD